MTMKKIAMGSLAASCLLAATAQAATCTNPQVGINLSGAEFGQAIPGVKGQDYSYPGTVQYSSAQAHGLKIVRVPFLWERVQPVISGDLDAANIKEIDSAIAQSKTYGLKIILDMHNSAMRGGVSLAGNTTLINGYYDFWTKMAKRYAGNDTVIFGLMNEPIKIEAAPWVVITQATINQVRQAGFSGPVMASGVSYSGVHSWLAKINGTSNADALATLTDPSNNLMIDMHQYFDSNFSGTSPTCNTAMDINGTFVGATTWLVAHKFKGFLGEYGGSPQAACLADIDNTLTYLEQHQDAWSGSTYWSSGGSWSQDYPYVIDFKTGAGSSQLAVIEKHTCK